MAKHEEPLRALMNINKALADQSRVRILMALRHGELCACQLMRLLDLAPSTVSKHVAILRRARLVHTRKSGRWSYHRLAGEADEKSATLIRDVLDWVQQMLASDSTVHDDDRRLEQLLQEQKESGSL